MGYLLMSLAIGIGGAYLLFRRIKNHGGDGRGDNSLSPEQKRFLLYAIVLEAQQIQMYRRLSRRARKRKQDHLAVGFQVATEVEGKHLMKLRQAARKFRVKSSLASQIGHGFGQISGRILSLFDPGLPLRTVVAIENKAASDYSKAREGLKEKSLLDLYLANQVDEEYHSAWAKSMLENQKKTQQ